MSVVRITTVTFKSQQAADAAAQSYKSNAVSEFPSASQLIGMTSEGHKLTAISVYASQEAMDASDAARNKRMANPEIISMDVLVGDVSLNHTN